MATTTIQQYVRSTGSRRRLDLPGPYDEFILSPTLRVPGAISVIEALALVEAAWLTGTLAVAFSEATLARYLHNLRRFATYATAAGAVHLSDCTAQVCAEWVHALPSGGTKSTNTSGQAAYGTQASRRTSLINFFATCHRLGLWDQNPGERVATHGRSERRIRPLTSEEAAACMDRAAYRARESRLPAVLAIGLAGATVTEIPRVRVSHVRLDEGMLWLPGLGVRYTPRWVLLDEWQTTALGARLVVLARKHSADDLATTSIVHAGDPEAQKVMRVAYATNQSIWRIFTKAGLSPADGVRPASILEYVANRVYAETGHIEAVAVRCGLKSLDSAAALLDRDWQSVWRLSGPEDDATGGPTATAPVRA
jgi:site-specific recombinase XerD